MCRLEKRSYKIFHAKYLCTAMLYYIRFSCVVVALSVRSKAVESWMLQTLHKILSASAPPLLVASRQPDAASGNNNFTLLHRCRRTPRRQ
jgi:hypothetical protein